MEALLARLRDEGVPPGAWLFDIARARASLRDIDELLLRLQRTIERHEID